MKNDTRPLHEFKCGYYFYFGAGEISKNLDCSSLTVCHKHESESDARSCPDGIDKPVIIHVH